ncbi:MAG: hypothetical protein HOV79_08405 [Hamadaea sp.]|nr:hypothetical protein [Hamadaea sp.]
MTPRTRYFWYAGCSAAIAAAHVILGYLVSYDADRRPGALELVITVLSYLLLSALYGLFAVVPALRGSTGRGYFWGAVAVGVLGTTAALKFDLLLNGISCSPHCVAAVPGDSFHWIAYAVSLPLAVVPPMLLALVSWPRSPDQINVTARI